MSYKDNIKKVTPYVPGEQPAGDVVKLNTNESPFPPSMNVAMAIASIDYDALRKYPDPDATVLVQAIADYYKVDEEQVFVGVGSDDVLAMAFQTFFNSDKPILFPDITYSFYKVWAALYDIPYEEIPLKDDFTIDASDYKKENGGVIFANPNAPTGVELALNEVEEIIKANPDSVVIVDEAYIDFGNASALSLADKYENLLVVRTFSKSRALAGMRVGYAIGSAKLIKALKDVKFSTNSYTLNLAAIRAGVAALGDDEYFDTIISQIKDTREDTKRKLEQMGFECLKSSANFLFVKHEDIPAKDIFEKLREKDIYVRYFELPRIDEYLRITIGTNEQMNSLMLALEEIVGN